MTTGTWARPHSQECRAFTHGHTTKENGSLSHQFWTVPRNPRIREGHPEPLPTPGQKTDRHDLVALLWVGDRGCEFKVHYHVIFSSQHSTPLLSTFPSALTCYIYILPANFHVIQHIALKNSYPPGSATTTRTEGRQSYSHRQRINILKNRRIITGYHIQYEKLDQG